MMSIKLRIIRIKTQTIGVVSDFNNTTIFLPHRRTIDNTVIQRVREKILKLYLADKKSMFFRLSRR